MKTLKLLQLLAYEYRTSQHSNRVPEAEQMNDPEQVRAFHDAGERYLTGLYHFNAVAIAALVPRGGTVVDLGSGSGQFLVHLGKYRPDLKIIGIELAERMVQLGCHLLEEQCLSDRVEIRQGDMTDFSRLLNEPVSLVSSVFSLHHLPTSEDLGCCLEEMGKLRARDGSAIWVFDHARPKSRQAAHCFPDVFTPDAAAVFNRDSTQSLLASWTIEELSTAFKAAGMEEGQHLISRILQFYQIHRMAPIGSQRQLVEDRPARLSRQALKVFHDLHWAFPRLELSGSSQ